MSNDPWIGDVNDGPDGVCCYSAQPGQPQCGKKATLHISSESAIYGPVALPTCDRHAATARNAGPFVAEHAYGPHCPGPFGWRDDGCVAL